MPAAGTPATDTSNTGTSNAGQAPAGDSQHRWEEMLASLAGLLPDRARCVLIDGPAERARVFAARHGHALSPDEPLAEGPLRRSTAAAGWAVTTYDDAPHRFFAVAERR